MKRFKQILPGIAVGLLCITIYNTGLFMGPEHFFEDILFSNKPANNNIVIVAIDNKSLSAIGQWPWKRAIFGEFLAGLADIPPKSVGIDVVFAEPSRYGETDDAQLAAILKNLNYPVVLPVEADPLLIDNGVPRANAVVASRSIFSGRMVVQGHVSLITDSDGIVRSVPRGVVRPDGSVLPLFSALVIGRSFQSQTIDRIAYVGSPGTIKRISFVDALLDPIIRKSLSGKYVFIGSTATDLHDEQLTPVSRGTPMSGVEIHAQIAQMLLAGDNIVPLSNFIIIFWILFAALVPTLIFFFIRSTRIAVVLTILIGLFNIPFVIILFEQRIIGNLLHVNLAWILGLCAAFAFRYYVTESSRRDIRDVFSKYVSKDVLEEILRDISKVRLGGEEKEVTVFFSDIRGFTTFSEKLNPTQLTKFLNRYLTRMTDIALKHNGVVDKYIGDAIMVFWGAPLLNEEHVLDAMRASLVMLDELNRFNKESVEKNEPTIDIGIGFNSGPVIVGNMGSEQRFDYTVIGDTVNLASRLEGQTKIYNSHIITSEFTMALVTPEQLKNNGIFVREIDRIRVKGKKLPVTIYEVTENNKIELVKKIKEKFDQLRVLYYKGEWQKVVSGAQEILYFGDDGPTKVLLERAQSFMKEPPKEWDGVYDMKTK